jgi:hypothetical protein
MRQAMLAICGLGLVLGGCAPSGGGAPTTLPEGSWQAPGVSATSTVPAPGGPTVAPIGAAGDPAVAAECREFQQTITVGGQTQEAYGTACRQSDGSWKIVP